MDEKTLNDLIKKLEAMRDDAFSRASGTNHAFQNRRYSAYHKTIELIRKAMKGERLV